MKKHFITVLLFLPLSISAQSLSPWELGASAQFCSYEGDLHDPNVNYNLKDIKPAVGVYARSTIGTYFAARFNLLFGQVAGADKSFSEPAWRKIRAASFKNTIVEGAVIAEIYPLSFFSVQNSPSNDEDVVGRGLRGRARFLPYVAFGLGGAFSNPIVDWNDANGNSEIDPTLAEIDKKTQTKRVLLVLPFGAGLRYRLTDQFTIHVEGLLRPTFSDYLDGFSQAGNPNKNDWFFTAGIGVGYTLNGRNGMYSNPTVN